LDSVKIVEIEKESFFSLTREQRNSRGKAFNPPSRDVKSICGKESSDVTG
jgi:hypothetical protein